MRNSQNLRLLDSREQALLEVRLATLARIDRVPGILYAHSRECCTFNIQSQRRAPERADRGWARAALRLRHPPPPAHPPARILFCCRTRALHLHPPCAAGRAPFRRSVVCEVPARVGLARAGLRRRGSVAEENVLCAVGFVQACRWRRWSVVERRGSSVRACGAREPGLEVRRVREKRKDIVVPSVAARYFPPARP